MNPPRQKRADSGKAERGIRDMPERIPLRIVGDVHRVCGKIVWADHSDSSDLLQVCNDPLLDGLEERSP